MDFNEALEKLKDSPELAKKLEGAIGRKADPAEIREILADAGVDSELAEALIAVYQRECGMAIADEDLDEEMLKQVAGGGCGKCSQADDCDKDFKNSDYWGKERCAIYSFCDEFVNYPGCDKISAGS